MLAVGLFSLTGASAMAAPVRHVAPTHKVAKADEVVVPVQIGDSLPPLSQVSESVRVKAATLPSGL